MGRHVGPGYVRAGPITAGVFGIGCLLPLLTVLIVLTALIGVAL